jgi:hypothetical protein
MKKKIILGFISFLFIVVGGFAAYVWFSLNWSYSRGERAGFVQKFSHKGWLIKTWEGELTMIPVPGSLPEKFFFSVREDALAQRINASMGKKVAVVYEQHKGVPTTFFGETEFYVTGIKVLE